MTRKPSPGARTGLPVRAPRVRSRWLWIGMAATGVIVCFLAAISLTATNSRPALREVPRTGAADAAIATPSTGSLPSLSAALSAPPEPASTAGTEVTATAANVPATPPVAPLAGVPVAVTLASGAPGIPVVPVGVSADGVLDPPSDVSTAGWWVAGPRPGGPGRTLITGHIDSRTQGVGAFAALDDVAIGDAITITTADNQTLAYRVTARDDIVKTQLDPAVLLGSSASDLMLITCIGDFDTRTHSYESNLLVTAEPDPASAPT